MASSVEKAKKGLKKISAEFGSDYTLVYWPPQLFSKMRRVMEPGPSRAIFRQNSEFTISSIVLDTQSGQVLHKGQLCRYDEKSKKSDKASIQKFIEFVRALESESKVGDELNSKENTTIEIKSRKGKVLRVTPLAIQGATLRYRYDNRELNIDLKRLDEASVTLVEDTLGLGEK